ncbi:DHA2 family efflux MFS transporter permease subunit [Micromonospora sp. WMMD1128]|uniref:DHA2 family efflux MFS transporter permease subunit n=1 Tax=Micromonospora sp. WMMD1128 TaxID=3015150 RepID=UPI00248B3A42|nr:DHA2 family efflux MFS transporter permease subunit [Micromonospora sp. WMMD1128]WBB73456.1 DHA2 family efflux MFS transporter permease subunit [Micromonospora sp. WMMD1128]
MTTRLDAPPGTGAIPWRVWRLALVIAFGALISQLDTSIVSVGLNAIATDLDAELGDAQWIANAYLIALGMSLPASGWLGRRFGVGRMWLASLGGFTVASVLCALADGVWWLVAARVLQGLTAGLLVPAGQTVLGQAVGPHRLGRVMATLGIAVTLGPALGPVLGGLIVHAGPWPWLFLVNVPLGGLGLWLGLRYVPHGRPVDLPSRLDWPGLLLIGAGVPLLIYGLTMAGERGVLAPGALVPTLAGLLLTGGFTWHARRVAHPILDLRLFARPAYAAATVTAAFAGAVMFGASLLFPLYFQIGHDADVLETGLALIPLGLGTAVLLPVSGRLVDRFGGGVVSFYGILAAVATTAPFALAGTGLPEPLVLALLFLRGMALALAVVPAGISAYKAVAPDQLPDATTQVNILQRVGGALGGAVFTVVLAHELSHGADAAFRTAFSWLTVASALGLASAAWLALAERRSDMRPRSRTRSGAAGY